MRATSTLNTISPASTTTNISPWHSPIPYVFGGLAAMLGLIAFALLILACSYRKQSINQQRENENEDEDYNQQRELEECGQKTSKAKMKIVYEEKIVVIMAGDVNPTFLATPIVNYRGSSFRCGGCVENDENKEDEKTEEKKGFEESSTIVTMEEE